MGLFVLAVFYTLHLAQAFFLPIVLAVLLDFLLSPLVRALRRIGLPEPAGAGLVVLGLLGMLGLGSTTWRSRRRTGSRPRTAERRKGAGEDRDACAGRWSR